MKLYFIISANIKHMPFNMQMFNNSAGHYLLIIAACIVCKRNANDILIKCSKITKKALLIGKQALN